MIFWNIGVDSIINRVIPEIYLIEQGAVGPDTCLSFLNDYQHREQCPTVPNPYHFIGWLGHNLEGFRQGVLHRPVGFRNLSLPWIGGSIQQPSQCIASLPFSTILYWHRNCVFPGTLLWEPVFLRLLGLIDGYDRTRSLTITYNRGAIWKTLQDLWITSD
jgi:hypothetical protein